MPSPTPYTPDWWFPPTGTTSLHFNILRLDLLSGLDFVQKRFLFFFQRVVCIFSWGRSQGHSIAMKYLHLRLLSPSINGSGLHVKIFLAVLGQAIYWSSFTISLHVYWCKREFGLFWCRVVASGSKEVRSQLLFPLPVVSCHSKCNKYVLQ